MRFEFKETCTYPTSLFLKIQALSDMHILVNGVNSEFGLRSIFMGLEQM